MSQNGYGQFFKAARNVKKDFGRQHTGTPMKGMKVSDILRNMKARRKTRKPMPIIPLVSASCMFAAALYAYMNLNSIEKFLGKVEITLFGSAIAQKDPENSAATKEESKEKTAQSKSPEANAAKKESKDWTAEQLAFFNKLEEKKQQLDAKEKELQKLEEELQEQKLALEKRLRDLEDIRTKISTRLDEKVKIDQEKVEKLVEFYSNMKPVNAAKVFENLDEDLAVEILNKMKKKSAADIMNLLNSEKAQKISERFAGYKRQ